MKTRQILFVIEDENFFKNILKRKKFDSELVFNDRYLKTKTKSYNNSVKTIFKDVDNDNSRETKEGVLCICLSGIVLDSVFDSHNHYFPQALLEECQQKIQEKEIKSSIANNFEGSSGEDYYSSSSDDDDDNDDDNSDERDNVYPLLLMLVMIL